MEAMVKEVVNCTSQGRYSGSPISCYRRIRNDEYIFDDEEKLRQFLMLSEEGKEECDWTYKPNRVPLNNDMSILWKANGNTERRYFRLDEN